MNEIGLDTFIVLVNRYLNNLLERNNQSIITVNILNGYAGRRDLTHLEFYFCFASVVKIISIKI